MWSDTIWKISRGLQLVVNYRFHHQVQRRLVFSLVEGSYQVRKFFISQRGFHMLQNFKSVCEAHQIHPQKDLILARMGIYLSLPNILDILMFCEMNMIVSGGSI